MASNLQGLLQVTVVGVCTKQIAK